MFPCSRARSGSYPPHTVLTMPALSPTMTKGKIASWNLKEGCVHACILSFPIVIARAVSCSDKFKAGASFADIETDKANVSFDAMDSGFMAKILVAAGAEADVNQV